MPGPILEIQSGKHIGKKVKLKLAETIIGRQEGAKIRVASKDVSREHCALRLRDGRVFAEDLGSSNGTFINGRPITGESELTPGDQLTVGPMVFQLLGKSKPASTAPKVAIKNKEPVDQRLSDDDIASWLLDDIDMSSETSDTTIIKNPPRSTAGLSSAEIPVTPPPPKREFASVAEEAQDIIRRHHEMVAQQEADAE